jgi:hypothetical protein
MNAVETFSGAAVLSDDQTLMVVKTCEDENFAEDKKSDSLI